MAKQGDAIELSQKEFEMIDRYLSGEMAMPEKADFENRLQNDSRLNAQVEAYRVLFNGVEEGALEAKLEDFHQKLFGERPDKKEKLGKRLFLQWSFIQYAAAAAIVFVIGIGSWWALNTLNQEERLFAQHFKPDPGLPTLMNTDSDYDFYVAMVDYKRGEYDKAISQWEALLKDNPESDTLNYFIGVAYLAANQANQAIPFLEKAVQNTETVFLKEAYYYLGLSQLKTGNIESAKENFEKSDSERGQAILMDLND